MTTVGPSLRGARAAVATVFFTNGVLFANVVPRYPDIKRALGLSNRALGAAVAAMPLGALVVGLVAAALITRFGSARVATAGIAVLAASTVAIAAAPVWVVLAVAFFAAGGIDAVVDVAQNAHGLRVQRHYGRSIVNSFHGVWSIGAVVGGAMGSVAAGLRIPLVAHLGASAIVFAAVGIVCRRFLLDEHEGVDRAVGVPSAGKRSLLRALAMPALLTLGVLAACGGVVEDAGATWGAIYLRSTLGTAAGTAGLAFVALQVAMTTGRVLGDRAVDRFGTPAVTRAGGLLIVFAMGAALAVGSVPATVIGFALAGLGVATLVPATMHAADELPGLQPGAGLMIVTWLLRVGFFVSPPVVGVVADTVGLRVGLTSVVVAGVVIAALASATGRRMP